MKAIQVKPEEATMGNDDRNEMLRSTGEMGGKRGLSPIFVLHSPETAKGGE